MPLPYSQPCPNREVEHRNNQTQLNEKGKHSNKRKIAQCLSFPPAVPRVIMLVMAGNRKWKQTKRLDLRFLVGFLVLLLVQT